MQKYGVRIIPRRVEKNSGAESKMKATFDTLIEARRYIYDRIIEWKGTPDTWIIYQRPYIDRNDRKVYFSSQLAMMYLSVISPMKKVIPGKRWVKYETTDITRYVNSDGTFKQTERE